MEDVDLIQNLLEVEAERELNLGSSLANKDPFIESCAKARELESDSIVLSLSQQ